MDLRPFSQEAPTIIGSVEGTTLAEISTEVKVQCTANAPQVSCSHQLQRQDWRSSTECEISGYAHQPNHWHNLLDSTSLGRGGK